jgi:ribosome-binding factor A
MSRKTHPFKGTRAASQRQLRVGENIRHILSEILARDEIRDPILTGVPLTVSEVRVSPDMKNASVFCTPLGGANADEVLEALNRHCGYIRGEMGRKTTLRHTPALTFVQDRSFDEAEDIGRLLHNVSVQSGANDEDDNGA